MVRQILEKLDKKQEELLENAGDNELMIKSAGLGMIEGLIDGFTIMGVVIVVGGIVDNVIHLVTKL